MTTTLLPPENPASSPEPADHRGKRTRGRLIPALLVLLGTIVLLYPVIATQYNNFKQQEFSQAYNRDIADASPEILARDLERARTYNRSLPGVPILDPWLLEVAQDPGSEAYKEYTSQLSEFHAMARVRVPSVGIDLPIYHGASDEVLTQGVGHLYGTSLPVGGPGSHTVLTTHSGMPNASLFDHLPDVKEGDTFFIDVYGETLAYRVDQIKVVLPSEIGDLRAEDGKDFVTLFTCTPYAVNTHRLLVRGERIPFTSEMQVPEQKPFERVWSLDAWQWGLLGAGALGSIIAIRMIVGGRKPEKLGQR